MAKFIRQLGQPSGSQGFTLEMAQRAMELDRLQTGGKNFAEIKAYYEFFNPEKPKEELAQERKLSVATGLGGQLAALETERRQMEKRGPTKGWIPAQLPFLGVQEPEAGGFDAAKGVVAYRLADVLAEQTGRAVSDRDIKVFENALPTRKDADIVAIDKLNSVVNQLEAKMLGEGVDPSVVKSVIGSVEVELKTAIKSGKDLEKEEAPPTAPTELTAPPTDLSKWLQQPGQKERLQQAAWSAGGPLAQMFEGKAENLPKVGATVGGALGLTVGHPHIGAGIGYAGGERIKQLATGGQVGDIEAQKQAALKGVGAGVLSRATQFGAEKVAAPVVGRVASKPLQWLLQRTGGGVTAPTETLAETAAGLSKKAPAGFQEEVGKEMSPFVKELYGKLYGGEKTMNLLPYRQQLAGKYDELSKYGGQALYKGITEQIHQQAPTTKFVDWLLSKGYNQILPNWLKRLGWGGVGAGTYQVGRKLIGR